MPLESINLAGGARQAANGADSGGSNSDFQATPEELRTIQEKMKDPVFAKLMHEYMESLHDPETLREEQAYLEQAEREARAGGDYSFEFIFPTAAFVVELLNPSTRRVSASELRKFTSSSSSSGLDGLRSFINMCSSDKVDEYREDPTGDRMGSNWHVPVSVSQKRLEFLNTPSAAASSSSSDNKEVQHDVCYVYDAAFHPRTLALADRSARFLCFLVEIAVEHINSGYSESNGFEFTRLSTSVKAIGKPKNQTVRKKDGKSPFAVDPSQPVLTKPTKQLSSLPEAASQKPPSAAADGQGKGRNKKGETKPAAPKETLPAHTITHRGRIDLSDTWQWKVVDKRVGIPEELVVKLRFPAVKRAAALAIDITEDGCALKVEKTAEQSAYEGLLVLPFTVESTPVSAKFERTSGELTLVLKVVPPPLSQEVEKMKREIIGVNANNTNWTSKTGAEGEEEEREGTGHNDEDHCEKVDEACVEPNAASQHQKQQEEEEGEATDMSSFAPAAPVVSPFTAEAVREVAPTRTEQAEVKSTAAAVPVLEHIADNSRAQAMLEKVAEARRAREAAASPAVTQKESETAPAQSPEQAPTSKVLAQSETTTTAARACSAEATGTPHETTTDDIPFIQKRDLAKEAEEAELRARQQAWKTLMDEEMLAATEREREEAAQAALRAEKEAAKARKKAQEEKERELAEERVRAKMKALPLANKHIFTID